MSQRAGQVKLGGRVLMPALSGLGSSCSCALCSRELENERAPQVSQTSQSHGNCPDCHPEQWKRTAIEAVRKGWVREQLFKQYCTDQRELLSGTCSSSIRNQWKPTCPIESKSVTKATSSIFSCCFSRKL